jgi:WD40 repeat protein
MRRWELSHYSVDYEIAPPTKTTDATNISRAECLAIRKNTVLSGWSDGTIRAYDEASGSHLWEIVFAHRGGVSCIELTPLYLVTAGCDGSVRVWGDGPSRQLLGNFDEHHKRVTGLCVDLANPNIIHSCGDDKIVVSVDLGQARRVGCHTVREGQLRSMAQASTGELELITADTAGQLKWWDTEEAEPVSMMVRASAPVLTVPRHPRLASRSPSLGRPTHRLPPPPLAPLLPTNAVRLQVTWSPMDDVNKERRITHIELSPPLAEGSVGSDYLLVCTASGDLQVWDLAETALVSVGSAHSDEITQARWAPDGKQIVSVGKDACICVWNFYGTAKPPGTVGPPPAR